MNNDYSKVEKISNEGYELEFGTILEDAFSNYKKIAGIGGLSMILVGIVVVVILLGIMGVTYGFTDFTETLTGLNPELMSGSSLLGFFFFSMLMAAVLSPINAGFIKMAYQADYDKPFGLNTIFDYFKGSYFKELFISAAIIAFFGNGINYLLNYFGIFFWGSLITYIVGFLTFLTIPLIIFSNLNAVQAITMSIKLVLKQPLILFGLLIVSIIFACLGIVGFCIGLFFTLPFLYSMYYTIYATIIPSSEESILDEIGQNQE